MFYAGDDWCPDEITSPSEILAEMDELADKVDPPYFIERAPAPAPGPFPCSPPYHRPDCYGTNCDDAETRERCDPF